MLYEVITGTRHRDDAGRVSRDLAGIVALLAAGALLAVCVEGYTLHRFTLAGVFAIAICGLNLLTGLSGQLSIGHGAFYARNNFV